MFAIELKYTFDAYEYLPKPILQLKIFKLLLTRLKFININSMKIENSI